MEITAKGDGLVIGTADFLIKAPDDRQDALLADLKGFIEGRFRLSIPRINSA